MDLLLRSLGGSVIACGWVSAVFLTFSDFVMKPSAARRRRRLAGKSEAETVPRYRLSPTSGKYLPAKGVPCFRSSPSSALWGHAGRPSQ